MYCKKCGKQINDGVKYCPYCGKSTIQEYKDPKKDNKNKFLYIGTTILAVIAISLACVLLFGNKMGKSYDDYMDEGKNYITQQNYEAAKDKFLKAYEFDDKDSEVYSYLYVTYSELDDKENAVKIDNEAQNLKSEQRIEYVEKVKEIIEENDIKNINTVISVSDYKVIDENVDDFDTTPLKISDSNYLVMRNGKYYYMDNNNNVIQGPFQKAILRDFSGKVSSCLQAEGSNACVAENGESVGYGIGGTFGAYFYLDGDSVQTKTILDGASVSYTGSMIVRKGVADNDYFSYSKQEYYIWSSNQENVFGPYSSEEAATFGMIAHLPVYNNMEMATTITPNDVINGLFYVKTDEGYVIYDQTGMNQSSQVFDSAMPLSDEYMQVTFNGKMGVIDQNFNFVIYGDFEDISAPIHDRCYVKKDGKWQLIEIQKVESNEEENKIDLSNVNVGDVVTFGNYNNEQLSWEVTSNNASTLTLLCQTGVAEVKYCDSNRAVTWSDSTICSWLNNDFYSQAFSEDEKAVIEKASTGDNVIIMDYTSIEELYDFSNGWTDSNATTKNGVSYWIRGDYTYVQYGRYQGGMVTKEGYLTHTVGTDPDVDATEIYARPVIYVNVK